MQPSKLFIVTIRMLVLRSLSSSAGLTDIAYSPFTMNRSGSYILVGDITVAQN
ncbi:MAG: hypothetical protein N3A72_08620 [bacterium]|nr:hypothetical protein [bacterium]